VNTDTSKGESPYSGSMVVTTNEMTQTLTQKMKNDLGINTLSDRLNKAELENDLDINTLSDRLNKAELKNSVWFDAGRTTSTSTSGGWRKVTYNQVRKSSTTGDGSSDDGISTSTGIFVCAIKGAYKFDFQAGKYPGYIGQIKLMKNGTIQKRHLNNDLSPHQLLSITTILELVKGDKVWIETSNRLISDSDVRITFTGFLLQVADEN